MHLYNCVVSVVHLCHILYLFVITTLIDPYKYLIDIAINTLNKCIIGERV